MDNSSILKKQRDFFYSGKTKSINFRLEQLRTLKEGILKYEDKLMESLKQDLNKSKFEAYATEIGFVLQELSFIEDNLRDWVKGESVKTPLMNMPGNTHIYYEPYGVVLIMSPWNYPVQLSLAPLIGTIAAGNCAMIKPSNYSPNVSLVLKDLIDEYFPDEYISVILGGREENQDLLGQKFDYIFFTGGKKVGRLVMEACSKNLTPLTLELGGKSPCIVDETADLKMAAKRITWGKFLNSGQTCVAPDYILAHKDIKHELVYQIKECIEKFYGETPENNKEFTKIINEKHFNRLHDLIYSSGVIAHGGRVNNETLQISPTILDNVVWEDKIMEDEIFGPILPIITYDNMEEIIIKINERPKPLALYLFTESRENEKNILRNISFGGGCINDVVMHLSSPYAPFGGVGESGMGSYHGFHSFETFSHRKTVFRKSNVFEPNVKYPPYSENKYRLIKNFLK